MKASINVGGDFIVRIGNSHRKTKEASHCKEEESYHSESYEFVIIQFFPLGFIFVRTRFILNVHLFCIFYFSSVHFER